MLFAHTAASSLSSLPYSSTEEDQLQQVDISVTLDILPKPTLRCTQSCSCTKYKITSTSIDRASRTDPVQLSLCTKLPQ